MFSILHWLLFVSWCIAVMLCFSSRDLGHDQGFVDEMRRNLRFMVAILIRRLRKVDIYFDYYLLYQGSAKSGRSRKSQ